MVGWATFPPLPTGEQRWTRFALPTLRICSPSHFAGQVRGAILGGVDFAVARLGDRHVEQGAGRLPAFAGLIDEKPLLRHEAAHLLVMRVEHGNRVVLVERAAEG